MAKHCILWLRGWLISAWAIMNGTHLVRKSVGLRMSYWVARFYALQATLNVRGPWRTQTRHGIFLNSESPGVMFSAARRKTSARCRVSTPFCTSTNRGETRPFAMPFSDVGRAKEVAMSSGGSVTRLIQLIQIHQS